MVFGEIHGMIEAAVASLYGEATVAEIMEETFIDSIDLHHALANMQAAGMCSLADGTVKLVKPSVALINLCANRN
jgi:hypothetical protein